MVLKMGPPWSKVLGGLMSGTGSSMKIDAALKALAASIQ